MMALQTLFVVSRQGRLATCNISIVKRLKIGCLWEDFAANCLTSSEDEMRFEIIILAHMLQNLFCSRPSHNGAMQIEIRCCRSGIRNLIHSFLTSLLFLSTKTIMVKFRLQGGGEYARLSNHRPDLSTTNWYLRKVLWHHLFADGFLNASISQGEDMYVIGFATCIKYKVNYEDPTRGGFSQIELKRRTFVCVSFETLVARMGGQFGGSSRKISTFGAISKMSKGSLGQEMGYSSKEEITFMVLWERLQSSDCLPSQQRGAKSREEHWQIFHIKMILFSDGTFHCKPATYAHNYRITKEPILGKSEVHLEKLLALVVTNEKGRYWVPRQGLVVATSIIVS